MKKSLIALAVLAAAGAASAQAPPERIVPYSYNVVVGKVGMVMSDRAMNASSIGAGDNVSAAACSLKNGGGSTCIAMLGELAVQGAPPPVNST